LATEPPAASLLVEDEPSSSRTADDNPEQPQYERTAARYWTTRQACAAQAHAILEMVPVVARLSHTPPHDTDARHSA